MKLVNIKILGTILFLLFSIDLRAQNEVYFEFTDGITDSTLKTEMENNASKLLTAINIAQSTNSNDVNFSGIAITDDAANSVAMLWSNVHMRIEEDDILTHCLTLKSGANIRGYEASGIAVEMVPLDDSFQDALNQEISIDFDRNGRISDFVISAGVAQYKSLMKDAKSVDDMDKRMQILHYVEQFRTAYCQKDIKFMENVFSDDALIITGREVIRRERPTDGPMSLKKDIIYNKQNKTQYLTNLRGIFSRNGYINVKFSEVTIERNGAKPNIYGVTCVQDWHTKNSKGGQYHDEGIVFMLWDFTDEEHPTIHVRTWQPMSDSKRFTTKSFKL